MYRRIAAALITAGLIGAGANAAADPGTIARFSPSASATRYNGMAFETCTAPTLRAMHAWQASSYRAIGVYIGGVNRTCSQPQLSADWTAAVTAMGWRMLPIYMGLQPNCSERTRSAKISPPKAASQGSATAIDAIKHATAVGMQAGSIMYLDVEHYDTRQKSCRTAVLRYVSGYTRELHRRGYLSGVYANLGSGARHLSQVCTSAAYARPDALWVARWDGSETLTGLANISDQQWSRYQRAKQYRGPHFETHGGVTLHIDSDWVNAPVATMARPYRVITPARVYRSPEVSQSTSGRVGTGSLVQVVCQASGPVSDGTPVWNKLSDGSYISDANLDTPTHSGRSSPIPPCFYAYQVVSADGLSKRSGPGVSFTRDGQLSNGSLVWMTCQSPGSTVGSTSVWDRIDGGLFVSDYYVTTPSRSTYSPPIPHCASKE